VDKGLKRADEKYLNVRQSAFRRNPGTRTLSARLVRTFFQKEFGPFGPGPPSPPAPGRPSAGGFLDPPDHDLVSRVRGGNEQNLIILIKQRT
jgi:hypothetical protein